MRINPSTLNAHNPAYWQLRPKWTDALNFYEPVPMSLAQYLTRHPKEDPEEFAARVRKLAQVNAVRMVIDFYLSMLFSTNIRISAEQHQEEVDAFVDECNRRGDGLVDYFREQVCPQVLAYGVSDVFVDLPKTDDAPASRQEQRDRGLDKPYCFIIPPLNRTRWVIDDAFRYSYYQSNDCIDTQINAQFQIKHKDQWQIWTPETYWVFDKDGSPVAERPNPYGIVPAVTIMPLPSVRFHNDKIGVSLIDDLVEIQREVLNVLSLISDFHAQVNFGQRVIIQDTDNGNEAPTEAELIETGNNRGIKLEGKGSKYEVVTPDAGGVTAMQSYVDQLLEKIWQLALIPINSSDIKTHTSAQGIKNNLQQLYNRLTRIARHFEKAMKQVIEMALRVNGIDPAAANVTVQWDTNFSYEAFASNIEQLTALREVASDIAPTAVKEYAKKILGSELYNSGAIERINEEIEGWDPEKQQATKDVAPDVSKEQNTLPGATPRPGI